MRSRVRSRWMGAILFVVLLMGAGEIPAKGAPAALLGRQEALAAVRRFFTLPDAVRLTPVTAGARPAWLVSGTANAVGPLAEVDAQTGQLLWVDLTTTGRRLRTGPLGDAYPRAEALARAWNLVRGSRPEWAESLRPAPDWLDWASDGWDFATYRFTWIPYVNDLPLLGAQVSVTVDRYNGELLSFLGGYPLSGDYPAAAARLAPDAALERYRQAIQPQLAYTLATDPAAGGALARLVYRFNGAEQPLNPDSGQLLPGPPTLERAVRPRDETAWRTPLTPLPASPAAPLTPPSPPLTDDQAIAYAGAVLGLSPGDATVSIQRTAGPPEAVELFFDGDGFAGRVTLDAATGLMRSAWRSSPAVRPDPGMPGRADALQTAVAAVQRYYGPWLDQLALPADDEPDRLQAGLQERLQEWLEDGAPGGRPDGTYSFFFPRHAQGIPVLGEGIRVDVTPRVGWTAIFARWSPNLSLPDAAEALNPAAAAEAFFAGRTPVLAYQPAVTLRQLCLPTAMPSPIPMQLVYYLTGPDNATALDAFSGRPTGPTTPPTALADRLGAHWAAHELLLLAATGILGEAELQPGAPMSRAQAYKLLAAYEWSPAVAGSGAAGPDQPVTRAEFATWVARTLGLGPLARSALAPTPAFTDLADLAPEARNAVNFLAALDLVKSGGRFRGSEPLTQAEGAVLFTRLLQRRYPDGLPWRLPAPFRFSPWTEPINCP